MPRGVYPRNEKHIEICRKARLGKPAWNKGTKGLIKPNKGSFGYGQKGHNIPHTEETKKKCSEAQKLRWKLGLCPKKPAMNNETKNKIRMTLRKGGNKKCIVCNNEYYASKSDKSKHCSFDCLKITFKNSVEKTQAKYPYKHLHLTEYKLWRSKVFARDKFTCQICGATKTFFHPHHKMSYTFYPDARYDINNGITLCVHCHRDVHRIS